MIEPQSGHGGASSPGRKANIEREGSLLAAATEDGPLVLRPVVVATGPVTRLIGTGPPGRAGSSLAGTGPAGPSASSFTCTPIARCWSLARNFEASQRKM